VPQNNDTANTKLVLIGEDDLDDQEFLKEIFSSIDDSFLIVFASNGEEVFDYLDEKIPAEFLGQMNLCLSLKKI